MEIFCPNPLCTDRKQSPSTERCHQCHTPLKIAGRYWLTEIVRTSPEHISGPEYYWYELFAASPMEEEGSSNPIACKIVKLLAIKEGFAGTKKDIDKARLRFEQEFKLLQANIPGVCKSDELLDLPLGNGSAVRAILMERVLGQNLEEYLEIHGAIDSQRALRWLQQLLTILQELHQRGIQHRDIKPSNIIVGGQGLQENLTLIDLGIASDSSRNTTTIQGSFGYIDPLYVGGKRGYENDSDLYSLGMTMVRLLTGKNPVAMEDNSWPNFVKHPPLLPELLITIEKAISLTPEQRFPSVIQFQQQLQIHSVGHWRKKARIIGFGMLGGAIIAGVIFQQLRLIRPKTAALHPVCNIEGINCGEEKFTIRDDQQGNAYQSITRNFPLLASLKAPERKQAIDNLTNLWEEYHDPEILIYLNNAKIQNEQFKAKFKVYTILVAVPGGDKSDSTLFNIDKSFLHGVARTQENFNNSPNSKDWKLHIAIVRDELVQPSTSQGNQQIKPLANEKVQEIANIINGEPAISNFFDRSFFDQNFYNTSIPDSNFAGVIGHYSSKKTFRILPQYAQNKIFVMSPSASRADLPAADVTAEHLAYFARVVASTKDASHKMVQELESLARQNGGCGIEIQIVSEPADSFSKSFAEEFQNDVQSTNSLNVRQHFQICSDICTEDQSPKADPLKLKPMTVDAVANLLQTTSQPPTVTNSGCRPQRAIALLPGAYTMTQQADNMKRIAKKIPPGTILVGHNTINDQNFLNYLGTNPELAKNTYITIPWHPLGILSQNHFGKFATARTFVGSILADMQEPRDIQNVNWRMITAADATQAYIAAIQLKQDKKNENKTFQQIIRDPTFRVPQGTSEPLAFNGFDRQGLPMATVVKLLPYCQSPQKVATVPLDYRDPQQPQELASCYRRIAEIPNP